MRSILTSVMVLSGSMMARRDRDRSQGHSNNESDTAGQDIGTDQTASGPIGSGEIGGPQDTTTANGTAAEGSTTHAESGANVDTGTGEMSGAGYDASGDIDTDVVALPKKIVAKEIVGRVALKCTKKFIPEKDGQGNPVIDKETGAPKGIWECTPPTMLYTVFGSASGLESGETAYGTWYGFEGTFEAVRTEDGKRFRSNRLILQEPAQTLLSNALSQAKARDKAASINFAFNVGKRTSQRWIDTNEGNSYEYTVESVINVSRHDPLAAMRRAILPHLPQRALPRPEGKGDLVGRVIEQDKPA